MAQLPQIEHPMVLRSKRQRIEEESITLEDDLEDADELENAQHLYEFYEFSNKLVAK